MTNWVAADVLAAVLNGVLQGVILISLLWLVLRLVRLSAAARYAIWTVAAAVAAVLPAVNLTWSPNSSRIAALPAPAGAPAIPAIALPAAGSWAVWILAVWMAVSSLLLARVAWSYWSMLRLKARSQPAPEAVSRRVRFLPGCGRHVEVRCGEVAVPVAAGLWKSAVILPSGLASRLSDPELDQVLLHELAHLRRFDDWTNLLQRVLEAALFFHPAVLWIGRRLAVDREIACDDSVVNRTGQPAPYAACLLKLATGAVAARRPQLAHAAISGKREFRLRIEALVAAGRIGRTSWPAVAAVVVALAASAAAAVRVGPFSVALPRLALSVPGAAVPAAAVAANAERPQKPRMVAAVIRPRARRATPLERVAPAVQNQPPVLASDTVPAAVQDSLRESTYFVFYWNEGGVRWIRVVWVQDKPDRAPLNGA